MDFDLTSEQKLIQDAAKRMVERDIQPILDAHDPDHPLPKDQMAKILGACADIGMIGGRVPREMGGAGLSMVDLGLMYEQIPANAFFGVLSQEVTAARVSADCTPDQKVRFLDEILAARKLACTATTEPGAGSDPRGIETRIVEADDGFRITGRKMWISNISICDLINVTGAMGHDSQGPGQYGSRDGGSCGVTVRGARNSNTGIAPRPPR